MSNWGSDWYRVLSLHPALQQGLVVVTAGLAVAMQVAARHHFEAAVLRLESVDVKEDPHKTADPPNLLFVLPLFFSEIATNGK